MGSTGSHLHQFSAGAGLALTSYGQPDQGFADLANETLNENRFTIADLAPAARRKIGFFREVCS